MNFTRGMLLALSLTTASAFTTRYSFIRGGPAWSAILSTEAPSAPLTDEGEMTKLFGRLADNLILLDVPGAGTVEMNNCCHGGCDNCPYSRIFDELRAGRPKWVAHYTYQEHIDGRNHSPPWVKAIFGENGSDSIGPDAFTERLASIPFKATLGPMKSVPADEPPSPAACARFFEVLANGSSEITAETMAASLGRLSGEEHGSLYRDFKSGLVAACS